MCFRSGVKSLYGLSRSVMWVVASSSVILFAPVIFEVERAQVAEMEKSQQKQVRYLIALCMCYLANTYTSFYFRKCMTYISTLDFSVRESHVHVLVTALISIEFLRKNIGYFKRAELG